MILAIVEFFFTYYLTSAKASCTLVADTGVVSHFRGTNMVDFDKDRDANLSAFERTGGAAANGITVRDYFAAQAMQALLSRQGVFDFQTYADDHKRVVDWAYLVADEMMLAKDHPWGSEKNPMPSFKEQQGEKK